VSQTQKAEADARRRKLAEELRQRMLKRTGQSHVAQETDKQCCQKDGGDSKRTDKQEVRQSGSSEETDFGKRQAEFWDWAREEEEGNEATKDDDNFNEESPSKDPVHGIEEASADWELQFWRWSMTCKLADVPTTREDCLTDGASMQASCGGSECKDTVDVQASGHDDAPESPSVMSCPELVWVRSADHWDKFTSCWQVPEAPSGWAAMLTSSGTGQTCGLRAFEGEREILRLPVVHHCTIIGSDKETCHIVDHSHSSIKVQHLALLFDPQFGFVVESIDGITHVSSSAAHPAIVLALDRECRNACKGESVELSVPGSRAMLGRKTNCFKLNQSHVVFFLDFSCPSIGKVAGQPLPPKQCLQRSSPSRESISPPGGSPRQEPSDEEDLENSWRNEQLKAKRCSSHGSSSSSCESSPTREQRPKRREHSRHREESRGHNRDGEGQRHKPRQARVRSPSHWRSARSPSVSPQPHCKRRRTLPS